MCNTTLRSLISPEGTNNQGKKITLLPASGGEIRGKISSVNPENDAAIIEVPPAGTKSFSLNTLAKKGW